MYANNLEYSPVEHFIKIKKPKIKRPKPISIPRPKPISIPRPPKPPISIPKPPKPPISIPRPHVSIPRPPIIINDEPDIIINQPPDIIIEETPDIILLPPIVFDEPKENSTIVIENDKNIFLHPYFILIMIFIIILIIFSIKKINKN